MIAYRFAFADSQSDAFVLSILRMKFISRILFLGHFSDNMRFSGNIISWDYFNKIKTSL